jgi:uncharacterized membrane protein
MNQRLCVSLTFQFEYLTEGVMKPISTIAAALGLVLAGAAVEGWATEYSFTWINYPGAIETRAQGINDVGDIVGEFQDDLGYHAFILSGGVYTPFDHPDAVTEGDRGTRAYDINSVGQIVGSYDVAGRRKAYLRDGSGYVDLSPWAASLDTRATEINDSADIVGSVLNLSHRWRGFLFDGTSYATFSDPTAVDTLPVGMNNDGVIVGAGWESSGYPHAFLRDANRVFTTFRVEGWHSEATGINDSGQIVGNYGPDYDECYGYVLSGGIGSTPDRIHVPGATMTEAIDINNVGRVVGFYTFGTFDSGPRYGYLATPIAAADFDQDGDVDGADMALWQGDYGLTANCDADDDGDTDGADFLVWQRQLGGDATAVEQAASLLAEAGSFGYDGVPEPTALALGSVWFVVGAFARVSGRAVAWRTRRSAPVAELARDRAYVVTCPKVV